MYILLTGDYIEHSMIFRKSSPSRCENASLYHLQSWYILRFKSTFFAPNYDKRNICFADYVLRYSDSSVMHKDKPKYL